MSGDDGACAGAAPGAEELDDGAPPAAPAAEAPDPAGASAPAEAAGPAEAAAPAGADDSVSRRPASPAGAPSSRSLMDAASGRASGVSRSSTRMPSCTRSTYGRQARVSSRLCVWESLPLRSS